MRALKEGDRSQESGEHNDHHVKDQLQKQKEGKGHWKPELASNSEEAVSVFFCGFFGGGGGFSSYAGDERIR